MAAREKIGSQGSDDPGATSSGVVPPGAARANDRLAVWRPLLARAAGLAFGVVLLAAVGLVSAEGHGELQPAALRAGLSGEWLSPGSGTAGASRAGHKQQPTAQAVASGPEPNRAGTKSPAPSASASSSPTPSGSSSAPNARPASGVTADGKVILNTATATELRRLPGVGAKRAEKIVMLRERLGRFKKPSDLLRVRGIGVKSLRKMLPHLVVDPP